MSFMLVVLSGPMRSQPFACTGADQRAAGALRNLHITLPVAGAFEQGTNTSIVPPRLGVAAAPSGPFQARQPSCGDHSTLTSSSKRTMADEGGSPSMTC